MRLLRRFLLPASTLFLIHCSSCNSYITPPPPRQTFRRWGENIEQSVILILTRMETKHKESLISSSFFLMFGTSESLVGGRRRRMRRRGRDDFFHTWWCWKSLISPWLISFASFTLRVWDDVQFSHTETVRNHQETFLQRGSVCLEFKTPPCLTYIDFSSMHWERYWLGEKDRGTHRKDVGTYTDIWKAP